MIYKFNSKSDFEDFKSLSGYEVHEHFKNGGKWTELTDKQKSLFEELWHPETYKNGVIRQLGWKFDMSEFFNEYWVEIDHVGIIRLFAPCVSCIREMAVDKHLVRRIVLIRTKTIRNRRNKNAISTTGSRERQAI